MIDPRLVADVQKSEGLKLYSYQDSEGLWTIGWGHLILPQPKSNPGLVWTRAQADEQLEKDIQVARLYAASLPEWGSLDTDCRRNALTEIVFEMDHRWLAFVNTRKAIKEQNWKAAHDGLLNSLWASQVHANRADRLADYLLTGEYPVGG